jgi:hypothetical protein
MTRINIAVLVALFALIVMFALAGDAEAASGICFRCYNFK